MPDCLIAFGANLGDPEQTLVEVTRRFDQAGIDVVATSQPLKTKAIGGAANQPDYFNAAIKVNTPLAATEMMKCLLDIEQQLGRVRGNRWESRSIDLDLLLFGEEVVHVENANLNVQIPHPRMSFRRFVLQPAVEVAADMKHPVLGATLRELLDRIDQEQNLILCFDPYRNDSLPQQTINSLSNQQRFADHEFLWMETQRQLDQHALRGKLLIWFPARDAGQVSGSAGEGRPDFAGPTLSLNPNQVNQWMEEITAAVDAMRPI